MLSRYNVIVAPAALIEAVEIAKFIKEDSPQAAGELMLNFEEAFASLETTPLRGALIPENSSWGGQYRHLLRGPYRIIYKISEKEVSILKIVHGARMIQIEPGKSK